MAANILNEMAEPAPDINSFLAKERIEWKNITPAAPWQGGAYERLVGIAKRVIQATLGRKAIEEPELRVILYETEAIMNSRPLTKVDTEDLNWKVIRPIDFIYPDIRLGISSKEIDDDDDYRPTERALQTQEQVEAAWKHHEKSIDALWKSWQKHYLPMLRERQVQKATKDRPSYVKLPKEGDVVLVKEDVQPRNSWKTGRITEVLKGSDGIVRAARILVSKGKILERPINLLIPLEIREENTQNLNKAEDAQDQRKEKKPPDKEKLRRSERIANLPPRNYKEEEPDWDPQMGQIPNIL